MPVGLRLPPGAVTILGHPMDLSAEPWGPSGGSIFGSLNPDPHGDPEGFKRWRELHARRYGPAKEGDPSVISFPGYEHPQWQSWLTQIAQKHAVWFAEQGLGQGNPFGAPTLQEIFDAQAWSGRDRIAAEGKRLFELDGGGTAVGGGGAPPAPGIPGTATSPPTPPAGLPLGPPLSPLAVRVEELRSHLFRYTSHTTVLDGLLEESWPAFLPFAIEGLRVWRLLRCFLGDGRPLPPEG